MARRPTRVVRPPRVRRDIVEIASYIGQDSLAASDRFVAAVERTVARLSNFPLAGRPYPFDPPELAQVRMIAIARFRRYLLFYRVVGSEVQLLRLIHGARDIPTLLEGTLRDGAVE